MTEWKERRIHGVVPLPCVWCVLKDEGNRGGRKEREENWKCFYLKLILGDIFVFFFSIFYSVFTPTPLNQTPLLYFTLLSFHFLPFTLLALSRKLSKINPPRELMPNYHITSGTAQLVEYNKKLTKELSLNLLILGQR